MAAGNLDPRTPIDIDIPGSGPMAVPLALVNWLEIRELLADFRAELARLSAAGTHGDAFTPFAEAHRAPPAVREAIAGFGAYMDDLYGL